MRPDGVAVRAVLILWFGKMPIVQIQQKDIGGNLKGRNEIASAWPHLPDQ